MELAPKMSFLTFLDVNIWFAEKERIWKSYTIVKALPTTKKVELIDKREFAAVVMDENSKIFVIHMTALKVLQLESTEILIDPFKVAQITQGELN